MRIRFLVIVIKNTFNMIKITRIATKKTNAIMKNIAKKNLFIVCE